MFQALRRYSDFSDRSTVKEFWLWILFVMVYIVVTNTILGILAEGNPDAADTYLLFTYLILLPFVIPSLSVAVRRLHDTERSGFWMLINLLPVVGSIWFVVLMFTPGTQGYNVYGADPR